MRACLKPTNGRLAQTTGGFPLGPSTSRTQDQKPRKGKKGSRRLSDAQLTTVASTLGVSLEQLKAAQVKVKAAIAATAARETRAGQDSLLAPELA